MFSFLVIVGVGLSELHSEPCIVSISQSLSMLSVVLPSVSMICGLPLIHVFMKASISEVVVLGVGSTNRRTLIFS